MSRRIPVNAAGSEQPDIFAARENVRPRLSMAPLDLHELTDSYVCYLYTNGPQETFSIKLAEGLLSICPASDANTSSEFQSGHDKCNYVFLLPANADCNSAQAFCQDGVLKVVIRKNCP